MKTKILTALSLIGALMLSGCTKEIIKPDDPMYAPIQPTALVPPERQDGSLYQSRYNMGLFNDRRAHRIGDIITVVLQEKTNAKKSASTDLTKEQDIDFDPSIILGKDMSNEISSTIPLLKNIGLLTSLSQKREFAGEGDSDQSNSLSGQITVTVSNVMPNGVLEVRGEKWMTFNQGDEYIRIKGLVRPDDISDDNTIMSNRIADARITYSGTGDLADANRQGWLARFFSSEYWPF
ncbi:flagellar basal body L-ring protein FlgH [Litoribrevibacter albus]|uniref:Flagellar L-ring protein n=1 Tax=Litoribrevibacter albus TaxID=1473156 RepID=A0AA37W6L0_9GAMM|nr:flagellar basal body L-ring protein FlgH [Litoribrevibacter albus]GLQ32217.1 flagellar L-ring protein [Litoribrevibacter albus]